MPSDHSITIWLRRLANGDATAAEPIWKRFFRRMTGLARKRLSSNLVPSGEEEDVALSAFHQFCRAAVANRFPNLEAREELWKLLAALTARKAVDHCRVMHAQKRGLSESVPFREDLAIASGHNPAIQALLADEIRSMFDRLDRPSLQAVAELKLNGLSNEEIARELGCTVRTVNRRLGLIREIWLGAAVAGNPS